MLKTNLISTQFVFHGKRKKNSRYVGKNKLVIGCNCSYSLWNLEFSDSSQKMIQVGTYLSTEIRKSQNHRNCGNQNNYYDSAIILV